MLMCGNCMTYNPEGTIFYQAAKKLLASGLKLISKVVVQDNWVVCGILLCFLVGRG